MTNQPTDRLRSGHAPGRRDSGCGRRGSIGLLVFGLLAGVSPTWAAEVVEVRVGRHPEFTRVVFELDRSAGYRIERSDPSSKESELIVSLEAGSIPRRIQSTKSFIEQVVVEPNGTRSVARIRLARGGLRLKEMILASPPRIVLDVIDDKVALTATSSTPKASVPATKPTVAASKPSTPAASKPAAAPMTKLAQAPSPAPTPIPAAKPVIAQATPSPSATPSPQPAALPSAAPKSRVLASTENAGTTPSPSTSPQANGAGIVEPKSGSEAPDMPDEWNDGGATAGTHDTAETDPALLAGGPGGAADAATAGADAAGEIPKSRPMMVKSSEGEGAEGGGFMTWTLAGLGLAAAAFAGLVVARRRRAAAGDEGDQEAGESPFDDEEEEEQPATSDSTNPFAELTGGSASLASGMTKSAASAPRATDKQEKKPSESLLFDDAEEKTMENMEVISRAQVNESLGGAMPMMGAGSDELTQMFREMQRRVAALEGRIDELVDARDRLERQVAAQTEELRVQRAAIARTQRAVRNLARPEEGTDDEPTEPALREPN